MNPFRGILQIALSLFLLVVFLILAYYLFVVALVAGVSIAAFFAVRRWLKKQGILGPSAPPSSTSIIEAEYIEVTKKEE